MFTNLTDTEFYIWLAGFFDGEGNIYLSKKQTSSVNLTISNTNGDIIKAIHKRVNLGQVSITTYKKDEWKDKYNWRVRTYLDTETILLKIYPYLYIKKTAALEALNRISRAKEEKKRLILRNKMIVDMLKSGQTGKEVASFFGVSETLIAGIRTGRIKVGAIIRNRVTQSVPVWQEKTLDKSSILDNNHTQTKIIEKSK